MKKKSIIILVVLLVVLGTGGFMALRPQTVECIKIESENYRDVFKEDGKIVSDDQAVMYAATNEKVVEININEGQTVNKGDVLLKFDNTTLQFQLENLIGQKNALLGQMQSENEKVDSFKLEAQEKQIEIAKSNLDTASSDLEKYKELYEKSAISKNELDNAKKLYDDSVKNLDMQSAIYSSLKATNKMTSGSKKQYEGLVQQIDAQIMSLQYEIDQCTVIAPMSGVVSEFNLKLGDRVLPETPILKVFDPNAFKVEAYVLSSDASGLKPNSKIQAIKKVKGEDLVMDGYIESIAPTAVEQLSTLGVSEQRVKVVVKLDYSQEESESDMFLRPGEKLDVQFTAYEAENCLVLPKDAVFTSPSDADVKYVWIVRDNKTELAEIDKIYETSRKVVVDAGIQSGDLVVYPLKDIKLSEGGSVKASLAN